MNSKIEQYLDTQKKQQETAEKLKREKELLNAGIYDKEYLSEEEYSKINTESSLFNNNEYTWDGENRQYYKKVVPKITEEEYKEFKKYYIESVNVDKKPSKTAEIISVFSIIIMVAGFVGGLVVAANVNEMQFFTMLAVWVVTAFYGTMIYGFSEIIRLLNNINNKE